MTLYRTFALAVVSSLAVAYVCTAQSVPSPPPSPAASTTIDATYPGLASGALTFGTLGDLPEGVLLRSNATKVTAAELEERIGKAPEETREALKKNAFFLLEQMATKDLVLETARQKAAEAKKDISAKSDEEILQEYFKELLAKVTATDDEVAAFYEENKGACGGATLEQMKSQLQQYVTKEKRDAAIQEHVRTLGQRLPIEVSAAWAKEQAVTSRDNPVDKARANGKVSMVDFGSDGCRPCEMMVPILADLKRKYEGKANILFVHTREEPVLAARFNIRTIPVQAFFDKTGKEVFRHVGFFPQPEIEKKLAELGVQ